MPTNILQDGVSMRVANVFNFRKVDSKKYFQIISTWLCVCVSGYQLMIAEGGGGRGVKAEAYCVIEAVTL